VNIKQIDTLSRVGWWKLFLVLTCSLAAGISLFTVAQKGGEVLIMVIRAMFVTGLLSMVFIYLIAPLVNLFERMGVSRILAVSISYMLLIIVRVVNGV